MELELLHKFRMRARIFLYAPEGLFKVPRYSKACEVFHMTDVLRSVHDLPRFEVRGSVQDLRLPEVLGSVRDYPNATKSCTFPFLPGR